MLRHWQRTVAVIALSGVALWAAPQQFPASQKPATKNPAAKKPTAARQTVALQPATPPPPPSPEQMPAQPPQVSVVNGQLSITALNSTLSDVMTAVRRQTGAAIELPPGAGGERIAAKLGPGQPKDVIASLLNGSRFDYIILGSIARPGGIDRIILTHRQNQGAPQMNAQNPPPATQEAAMGAEGEEGEIEEDNAPEREPADFSAEAPPEEQEQEQQPAQQQNQPYQPVPVPQGQPGQNQQQGDQQNPQQPRVKTPEELLKELQQMRNQQQNPQQNSPQETPQEAPQSEPQ